MTYLSRIPINPLRREGQRLASNRHRMHAALLGGIAVQPVSERILWRLEQGGHQCHVLVLTQSRPNWDHLIENAGWPGADGGEAKIADCAPLLGVVVRGRRFSFRATLNTVASSRTPEAPTAAQARRLAEESDRPVRLGQRSAPYQLRWFLKRAADENAQWGFTVGASESASVRIVERSHERFTRRPKEAPVTIDMATFEGELEVTDPEVMLRSLTQGVGKAKAYGCGLITLAAAGGIADVVAG